MESLPACDGSQTMQIVLLDDLGRVPRLHGEKGCLTVVPGTLVLAIRAGSACAHETRVVTNYPAKEPLPFVRTTFRPVERRPSPHVAGDLWFTLSVTRRGTFEFQVSFRRVPREPAVVATPPSPASLDRSDELSSEVSQDEDTSRIVQSALFRIDPPVEVGGVTIPLEALCIQTYIAKCLGPVEEWENSLRLSAKTGYSMIHFTPLQELGSSGSSYSIYDQLTLSSKIFGGGHGPASEDARHLKLRNAVDTLERMGVLSMTDVVWNHTASNSPWLNDHPEAGYTLDNSPHLKAAYTVDEAILLVSLWMSQGKEGLAPELKSEEDLQNVMKVLRSVLQGLRLWQYFTVDVDSAVLAFRAAIEGNAPFVDLYTGEGSKMTPSEKLNELRQRALKDDGSGERGHFGIHLDVALSLFATPVVFSPPEGFVNQRCEAYRKCLDALNLPPYECLDRDLDAIITNVGNVARWERLDPKGPRRGPVSIENPLVPLYFTRIPRELKGHVHVTRRTRGGLDPPQSAYSGILFNPLDYHVFANNGWVGNWDIRVDFAGPLSSAYFRREVVAWADCVKLRYGNSPADNPWLWEHMRRYTSQMASYFYALRIDNCHSTPLSVGEYMIDAARGTNPNIIVVAELFTGSEELDSLYAGQLGMNALIREAMAAPDTHDLGRIVLRHGGRPVGSMTQCLGDARILHPSLPPSCFVDCTHDNEMPTEIRTSEDTLPNAALVAMGICASWSTRGYDEIIPRKIDLVKEDRRYVDWEERYLESGIVSAKAVLNQLHRLMALENFTEIHVHQVHDVIAIHRHNPKTHDGIYMIVRTMFHRTGNPGTPAPIRIPGKVQKLILAATVRVPQQTLEEEKSVYISGLDTELQMSTSEYSPWCRLVEGRDPEYNQKVKFTNFPPGSVVAFRVSIEERAQRAVTLLREKLTPGADPTPLHKAFKNVSLVDLNVLLYRCDAEERDATGMGTYEIPACGSLLYSGLQGFVSLLDKLRLTNDMGHPMFDNLRGGDWMMDYIIHRMDHWRNLDPVRAYTKGLFDLVKRLPRYLIPRYFDDVVTHVHSAALNHAIRLMSPFVQEGSVLVKSLALGSVQMIGVVRSAPLLESISDAPSLSAGLPHFSTGYMRNWGRDTFISLRGLCLVTGRYSEARALLCCYASCLRHGLIPNLLDGGRNSRFNARDAVWWWLQGVQDYCKMAPEGTDFLATHVNRLFPSDDERSRTMTKGSNVMNRIDEIIQEIMEKHAHGIDFVEWGAGPRLDAHMQRPGFHVEIRMDPRTGFILGGNLHNCGTWMDKMGESTTAGNYGIPSTPRDGAAVEIIGLLKSALRWLTNLKSAGKFPYEGVHLSRQVGGQSFMTYRQWDALVQKSFEQYFFIPTNPPTGFTVNPGLVNRRGIYKDLSGSQQEWADYQLRPNQCIAMTVAPELFDVRRAQDALTIVEEVLLGPIGMKTLDPSDMKYNGTYDNKGDSVDYNSAKGFNYHQGPEWVWPVGYFLRACLRFADGPPDETIHRVLKVLGRHRHHIEDLMWASLPELTNENGNLCRDSCPAQAWSMGCILDALYDLELTRGKPAAGGRFTPSPILGARP